MAVAFVRSCRGMPREGVPLLGAPLQRAAARPWGFSGRRVHGKAQSLPHLRCKPQKLKHNMYYNVWQIKKKKRGGKRKKEKKSNWHICIPFPWRHKAPCSPPSLPGTFSQLAWGERPWPRPWSPGPPGTLGQAGSIATSPSPGAGRSHPAGMIPALPPTHTGRDSSGKAAERNLPVAGVASGLLAGSLPPRRCCWRWGGLGEMLPHSHCLARWSVPHPLLRGGHPLPRDRGAPQGRAARAQRCAGAARGGSPPHLAGRFSTFPCTG